MKQSLATITEVKDDLSNTVLAAYKREVPNKIISGGANNSSGFIFFNS